MKYGKRINSILIFSMLVVFVITAASLFDSMRTTVEDAKVDYRSGNTGSMYPTISPNTYYDVIPYYGAPLKCGHIYVYKRDNKSISHRYVYESNGEYYFKGDANPTFDQQPVKKEEIKAEVIGVDYQR